VGGGGDTYNIGYKSDRMVVASCGESGGGVVALSVKTTSYFA
jgi:hypothetical protein